MDDLKELLAKVESGGNVLSSFTPWAKQFAYTGAAAHDNATHALRAYHGSLDAAKALHKAVLPGWSWGVNQNAWLKYFYAHVNPATADAVERDIGATSDTPSRAWLIAILKALIAEGDQ